VRYGIVCPAGFLPVYSVDTEEEARRIIIMTCSLHDGEYYAESVAGLEGSERLKAFYDFGAKLERAHTHLKKHTTGKNA